MTPNRILPTIIFSQFAGTSLWFAGNGVLADLQHEAGLPPGALGYLTSAVQAGFIAGTFLFALLALADRFSPRWLFFGCALAGAAGNLLPLVLPQSLGFLVLSRFATGFFLAGIYPVGMKIAASWYAGRLGRAIGFLVGALVLGTAFPHAVRAFGAELPWRDVLLAVSLLAAVGGVAMAALVPDGPHLPRSGRFVPGAVLACFKRSRFRAAALGYFGHMWELYAFWAFVPVLLAHKLGPETSPQAISWWSFGVIAIGAPACAQAGIWSLKRGSAYVGRVYLAVSGLCCLLSPVMFTAPWPLFVGFLLLWGCAVIGDSAQFSALCAQTAPQDQVGSALTMSTCVGFTVTIGSIQLLSIWNNSVDPRWLMLPLVIGPLVGLASLGPLFRPSPGEP